LDSLLGRIIAGECFMAAELPTPTEAERAAPSEPEAPEALPTLRLE